MICFGAKTDQEVKEKVTCGSHFKIKQNKNKPKQVGREREKRSVRERFLFFFSSLASLFDLQKSDRRISTGQVRKVLYSTRATPGNKKQGISSSFQLKIRKILCFGFSQIYGFLTVKIGRSRRQS